MISDFFQTHVGNGNGAQGEHLKVAELLQAWTENSEGMQPSNSWVPFFSCFINIGCVKIKHALKYGFFTW